MKQVYYLIDNLKGKSIAREYLNRRPLLKSVVEVSDKGMGHDKYPDFVLCGIRMDEKYEPLLIEYLEALSTGLSLLYGAAYEEFTMFYQLEYNLYGTDLLDRFISFA